ncbi:unnamed protein product [Linum trigynum]|uniref:AP2/ERF domain-containing protein n=1 Tax=Linum trigynum TaxID=586398 RepID=A0AAV2G345_9ROSI
MAANHSDPPPEPSQTNQPPPPPTLPPAVQSPPPAATTTAPCSPTSPSSSGRHPRYRGVRARSGKWVSEIREPKKTTRIWLGTYPTPEMAAAAYDVAALALKGPNNTHLNFPSSIVSYPVLPPSPSASDIRAAAARAAVARLPKPVSVATTAGPPAASEDEKVMIVEEEEEEFMDVDELLNMPNLLVDMAGGMMVSPPRIDTSSSVDDSPDRSDGGESLWSYHLGN